MIPPDQNPFANAAKNNKPLILDGAMGSLLHQKGFLPHSDLWMTDVNLNNPEAVSNIHKEYIKAGADIITTNTFRTNPVAIEGAGLKYSDDYVKRAVSLAKEARNNKHILIAGSNAPAEDCYQKERTIDYNILKINHSKHIDLLINNGVDFIINETQSHYDEIIIICQYCSKNKIPYVLSIYFNNPETILSGEKIIDVVKFVVEHNPLAIGFNCLAPEIFKSFINNFELNYPWGFYLNCIKGNYSDENINCTINTDEYIEIVKYFIKYSPSFIGGCCGTKPEYIQKIRDFYNG